MKRYLLFVSLLVMARVGPGWALGTPVLIAAQTYSDCVATCGYTHCCTKGENFTTYTCPTGWTYNYSIGLCARDPLISLSTLASRYTITTYTTCSAEETVDEAWWCTTYAANGGWTDCCVLNPDGSCSTISLM